MSLRYEQAETLLNAIGVYTILAEFDPLFTGTMPIDVDIETSDIDVICQVEDHPAFERLLRENYGDQENFFFSLAENAAGYSLCRFRCLSFDLEIYGQNIPVKKQNAWRHMEAERKLLVIGGEDAKVRIRTLKRSGLKTEPAFARYFALSGDPYQRLLDFSDMTVSQIMSALSI
ncbi:DUF4269 domain-containing protein [Sneathiella sp.]|jgi:hypothetical protein|uniref:DUF4269 domain-containing protein n=1 Tax=Sneathiella sp. TaxID=1964365 RepID=UPI0039E60D09